MNSLDGRVVLITGAGRGIGRQEALHCAAHGAKVVVNDPGVEIDGSGGDSQIAQRVVAEITAAGGVAVANTDSVVDWNGAARMVATAVDTFGDLHVVVNNAATEDNTSLLQLTEAGFDHVVAVKLKGTFAVSRWAAQHWNERYVAGDRIDRSIINTASGSGLLNPLPLQSNYASANAGVAALTTVHALELGGIGVRVNCLSPSMARTRLTAAVDGMPEPVHDGFDPTDPIVNAPVVRYLAAADCPLTGQVLSVRGATVAINRGWTLGPTVTSEGGLWEPDDLRRALDDVEVVDPYASLADSLSGALGTIGVDEVRALVAARVHGDG